MSSKPEIDFPEGPAPDDLVIEDITIGDGAEAVAGGTVHSWPRAAADPAVMPPA